MSEPCECGVCDRCAGWGRVSTLRAIWNVLTNATESQAPDSEGER